MNQHYVRRDDWCTIAASIISVRNDDWITITESVITVFSDD